MIDEFGTESKDAPRPTTREKSVEAAVCAYAKKLGWLVYKFTSPGNAGVPDRLFLRAGVALFVEFKAPGRKARPEQRAQMAKIEAVGVRCYVIDSADKGRQLFDAETL